MLTLSYAITDEIDFLVFW